MIMSIFIFSFFLHMLQCGFNKILYRKMAALSVEQLTLPRPESSQKNLVPTLMRRAFKLQSAGMCLEVCVCLCAYTRCPHVDVM